MEALHQSNVEFAGAVSLEWIDAVLQLLNEYSNSVVWDPIPGMTNPGLRQLTLQQHTSLSMWVISSEAGNIKTKSTDIPESKVCIRVSQQARICLCDGCEIGKHRESAHDLFCGARQLYKGWESDVQFSHSSSSNARETPVVIPLFMCW
jgi:hypothetical protein